jgi:hypothetical protein
LEVKGKKSRKNENKKPKNKKAPEGAYKAEVVIADVVKDAGLAPISVILVILIPINKVMVDLRLGLSFGLRLWIWERG